MGMLGIIDRNFLFFLATGENESGCYSAKRQKLLIHTGRKLIIFFIINDRIRITGTAGHAKVLFKPHFKKLGLRRFKISFFDHNVMVLLYILLWLNLLH